MKFNIKLPDKSCLEIDGKLLKNMPIKCFAHRDVTYTPNPDVWVVSEFFSGFRFSERKLTRKEAIESALLIFEVKSLEEIKSIVNEKVKQYGFANRDGTEKSAKKEAQA